jgi:hypothetical protein
VAEHLLCKPKALNSSPSPTTKKKERKKTIRVSGKIPIKQMKLFSKHRTHTELLQVSNKNTNNIISK